MNKLLLCLLMLSMIAITSCTPESLLDSEDFAIDQENVPGGEIEEDPEDDS